MLTERQRQILNLMARGARQGMSLSVRDIADHLGLRSPATVYVHLQALVRHGYVEQTGRSRRYRLVKPPGIVVAGVVQAGEPFESQEGPLGELALDPNALSVRGNIVALKVVGNSMVEAGIFDGDYVLIRRQPRVENGEIAAVLVNGAGTLKRVQRTKKKVALKAENARFEPIVLDQNDDVRIYGKLVGLLRGSFRLV